MRLCHIILLVIYLTFTVQSPATGGAYAGAGTDASAADIDGFAASHGGGAGSPSLARGVSRARGSIADGSGLPAQSESSRSWHDRGETAGDALPKSATPLCPPARSDGGGAADRAVRSCGRASADWDR